MTAALAANPEMTLADVRRVMEYSGDVTTEPRGIDYIESDVAGLPVLWASPKGCAEDRILCVHGGGYMVGSMYTYRKMHGHFAKAIGCRALIVDYSLAPEHPHPAAVNDLAKIYEWLLNQGITPDHIALVGDSAGGGLVMGTLQQMRQLGLARPAAAMLLSPFVDMEAKGTTFESNKDFDKLLSHQMIEFMISTYLGEKGDRRNPLANPLLADLRGLPPIFIQVGSFEVLLDDSRALAEALRKADVDVSMAIYSEMQHVFQSLDGAAPEADEAIAQLATWVRPKLGIPVQNIVEQEKQ
jgi:acetyl esterase/lipase